jgi:hypothetical protein
MQLFTEMVTNGFNLWSPANLKLSVLQVVSHRSCAYAPCLLPEQLANRTDTVIIENKNLMRFDLKVANVIDQIHITSEEK